MLTINFIPHHEIKNLNSEERIKKILKLVKEEKIVLLEGKLKKEEEALLIKATMEQISEKFKGIEIADMYPQKKQDIDFISKIKERFINIILGDRQGFTIIGPATIIKEIKNNPDKIELFTKEKK
jgi:hypothetical protein